MPWTAAQVRLFRAAEHNPEIARKHGLSQAKAGQMADEGVKHEVRKKHLVKKLREG